MTASLAFSEVRTSAADPLAVLDAYDAALEDQGFIVSDRAEPIAGVPQGVYFADDGTVLSVLVIGPEAMTGPDLEGLDKVVDPTLTLVVLLAFPAS